MNAPFSVGPAGLNRLKKTVKKMHEMHKKILCKSAKRFNLAVILNRKGGEAPRSPPSIIYQSLGVAHVQLDFLFLAIKCLRFTITSNKFGCIIFCLLFFRGEINF